MAAPMLLNARIILEEGQITSGDKVSISLSHFGADESGARFVAEYDAKQTARWGCTPVELRGGPMSYFGQMRDFIEATEQLVKEAPESSAQLMNNTAISKLQSVSAALSFLLNEWFSDTGHRESYIFPSKLVEVLGEQVLVLSVNYGSLPGQLECRLVPIGSSQSDVTLALANLSEVFNNKIPAHILKGNNAIGDIDNVKEYFLEDKDKKH
jgi:hypothetical protein